MIKSYATNRPRIQRNRQIKTAIALALTLSLAATIITALPLASGEVAGPTIANVVGTPNPVGVGQSMLFIGWINPPPLLNYLVYSDYTFTIYKPNGTTDTEYFEYSNTDASKAFNYVCDATGEWSITLSWPGDDDHLAVTSEPYVWTVQEDPVPSTNPDVPLPAEDWYWPISGQNRDWFWISGAWPDAWYDASGSQWNPYSKAPNTPHVLWTYDMAPGGLIGGADTVYGILNNPQPIVAAMGRMYYRYSMDDEDGIAYPVVVCLDQKTGEVIWERDMPSDPDRPSGGGALALDLEGELKYREEVVTDPTQQVELVSYPARFNLWMVGNGVWQIDPWTGNCEYYWPITVSATTGKGSGLLIDNNGDIYFRNYPESGMISKFDTSEHEIAWSVPGFYQPYADTYQSSAYQPWLDLENDLLMIVDRPYGSDPYGIAFSTWNLTTGEIVVDAAIAGDGTYVTSGTHGGVVDGVAITHLIDRYWYAIDLVTGQQRWKSDVQSEYPWGVFNLYTAANGYGLYYQGQFDGYLYALNVTTGKLEWKYYCGNNTDTAFGSSVPWGRFVIADEKIIFVTGEHDSPNPTPRGNKLICLNALTGDPIWEVSGFMHQSASGGNIAGISSGIMWFYNLYDGRLYAFGKGPTETTVSASSNVIAKGESVLIMGTVTDQSPAAKGTPALSDDSQAAWTEYRYTQNQIYPTDCEGVTVFLQAVRPDGTIIDIFHVKSDILGHYEYLWTPPDEDTYKILATFEGSESLYSSSAETAVGVTEAAGPSGPIEPEPTADYTIAIIAAVVAVVVVALVAVWAIRRRK